jgi:hypothetical protein
MRVGVNPCCEPRNPYGIVSATVKQTLQGLTCKSNDRIRPPQPLGVAPLMMTSVRYPTSMSGAID